MNSAINDPESNGTNCFGSNTISPNVDSHVYQNYPTPDLLDATFNSDYDSECCHSQCACGGFEVSDLDSPTYSNDADLLAHATAAETLFGFMNQSKSVSFRKQKSSASSVPKSDAKLVNCADLPCYLDPVQLNDNATYGRAYQEIHEYQNTRELLIAMLSKSQTLTADLNLPYSNDLASRTNNCGRNKLNLTIDTGGNGKRNNNTFYDPLRDYIINSPVIKKLRELVFKYPDQEELNRRRLLYAIIAILLTVIVILIILNVLVPKLLLAQTSPSFSSLLPTQIRYGTKFNPDSIETKINPNDLQSTESTSGTILYSDKSKSIYDLVTDTPTTVERYPPGSTGSDYPIEKSATHGVVSSTFTTTYVTSSLSTSPSLTKNSAEIENNSTTPVTLSPDIVSTTSVFLTTTYAVKGTTTKKPLTISTWLPTFPSNIQCQKDQFKCTSGVSRVPCLYKWERCDGIQDCSDGSDEIFCGPEALNCYGNYLCDDGSCVSLAKVCNGVFDCKDGSDEMKCENFTCQSYEYRCPSGYCIPHEWTCDGEIDCPDHKEEYNCSTSCSEDKFLCDEGWCIPKQWRCNGVPDCALGEDELNCSCSEDQTQCKSGGCVDLTKICDGVVHCADGSDEHNCVEIDKNVLIVREAGKQTFLPVCSQDWSKIHSDVVCKQLGFSKSSFFGEMDLFKGNFSEIFVTNFKTIPPMIDTDKIQFLLKKKPLNECKSGKLVKQECERFDCGSWPDQNARHKRIVGGRVSNAHEWPSVGILFHPQKKWACTASIFAPYWIVTSALCVRRTDPSPFDWKVIVGSAEPSETNPDVVIRTVKKFIYHPSYKFKTLIADYDVALVQLNEPLVLNHPLNVADVNLDNAPSMSDHVSAVCLPQHATEPGSWCVTAGWGYTTPGGFYINKQLKHLDMGIWLKTICNGTAHYPGLISDRMLCAGNDEAEWGPCFNDEGAPLMCHSSTTGKWYLAGVLTSQNCGSMKHPSVYADVYSMKNWISDVIGI